MGVLALHILSFLGFLGQRIEISCWKKAGKLFHVHIWKGVSHWLLSQLASVITPNQRCAPEWRMVDLGFPEQDSGHSLHILSKIIPTMKSLSLETGWKILTRQEGHHFIHLLLLDPGGIEGLQSIPKSSFSNWILHFMAQTQETDTLISCLWEFLYSWFLSLLNYR